MSANMQSVGDLDVPGQGFEELVQQFAESQLASDRAVEAAKEEAWTAVRELWVRQVHGLFDRLEGWLGSVIAHGWVEATREQRLLTEECLGEYAVESLQLHVGSLKIRFEPLGTLMLHAFGRIEVMGPQGNVALVLQGREEESPTVSGQEQAEWYILHPDAMTDAAVQSRSGLRWLYGRRTVRRGLTEDTFQQLFMNLFGIFY
jgi:hypothetical protein